MAHPSHAPAAPAASGVAATVVVAVAGAALGLVSFALLWREASPFANLSSSTSSQEAARPGTAQAPIVLKDHLVLSRPGWREGGVENVTGVPSRLFEHEGGLEASLIVMPVPGPERFTAFQQNLLRTLTPKGGVVTPFTLDDGTAGVRYLEPVLSAEDAPLVSINYALLSPAGNAVHAIGVLVPQAVQEPSDETLRALVQAAQWTQPPPEPLTP